MARVEYLTLAGKKYPMAFTMSAIERVEEEFGSVENMSEALQYSEETGFSPLIQSIETVFSILLDAAKAHAACLGEEIPPDLPCRIADFMSIADAQALIGEVIQNGSRREVEAAPSKKEEATAEDPAEAVRGSALPQPRPD